MSCYAKTVHAVGYAKHLTRFRRSVFQRKVACFWSAIMLPKNLSAAQAKRARKALKMKEPNDG